MDNSFIQMVTTLLFNIFCAFKPFVFVLSGQILIVFNLEISHSRDISRFFRSRNLEIEGSRSRDSCSLLKCYNFDLVRETWRHFCYDAQVKGYQIGCFY